MVKPVKPLERLRKMRLKKKLSIDQLAKAIGKTKSHLAKIERGEMHLRAVDAIKIAKLLDSTVEEIMK